MEPTTIGIAGAGVMGRVLAWQLLRAGFAVSLYDKDDIDHGDAATYTAAGMLAPYSEVESAELLVYQLGMRSLLLWRQLARRLGGDLGYCQQGSLVVSHPHDYADFTHFKRQLQTRLNPTTAQFRQLNRQQLALLEPELGGRFAEAGYLPEEACLCPRKTMKVLADNLLAKGIQWHSNSFIHRVDPRTITTGDGEHTFDCAIDCRGLGAKPQWDELRGVRGELILLQAPEVTVKRLVRLMHPRYRLYLVPKGYDDLYVVGATQIESNDRGPITVRSSLELLSAAYSLHPGFAEARIVDLRVNCRPALTDNLPRLQCRHGLIRVNGLFRHGFLTAPALGEEIVRYLTQAGYQSGFESLIVNC